MSNEKVLARWQPDRTTYIRDHVVISAAGAAGACAVLWFLGNSDWWVGLIAAPLAVGIRGWYLASEELTLVWEMTTTEIRGSQGKRVPLREVRAVRTLGSAVQLITRTGDKHLMKYLADPKAARARIAAACNIEKDPR